MTPATTQRFIGYVINYSNTLRNHISENSISDDSIEAHLHCIASNALLVIDRINKGDIITMSELVEACSSMGDNLFIQLCNDIDYEYQMNELAKRQREEYELPY
jgi:hypothetical protein